MKSRINLVIIVATVSFASIGYGRLGPAAAPVPAVDANAVATRSFPYAAEVVGDNVYIRSGPGTNYYSCGKLNSGDKLNVVSHQFSWSCVVPPAGAFSWIYMPYVSLDPDDPGTGIVTGSNVRVYAGSDTVVPIHSMLQLRLERGEKVKLLGEQKDNYYKIATPSGAYLWVSTKFTKPVVGAVAPIVTVDANVPVVHVAPPGPNDTTVVVVPNFSAEEKKLKEYRALYEKLKAERAKPMGLQNYAALKKSFEAIANSKDAGKAARYSEFVLRQIERYELVSAVTKELDLQDKQLERTRQGIERARSTRLSQLRKLGRFAVVGKLATSTIYGSAPELKHYRIISDTGKTICYARPTAGAVQMDLSKLIGRKVGLIGTIGPHVQTAGALVKFTGVVEMK